jgi:putative membrane protein
LRAAGPEWYTVAWTVPKPALNPMLWIKAFHIVFVVAWFAGLFYLPRLFVYHADTEDSAGRARFCIMERRLYVMMTVGAIGTLFTGAALAVGWWRPLPTWLLLKLVLVAALAAYHAACRHHVAAFAAGRNTWSSRRFRVFNEVPTLLLIGSVLLVVLKPAV